MERQYFEAHRAGDIERGAICSVAEYELVAREKLSDEPTPTIGFVSAGRPCMSSAPQRATFCASRSFILMTPRIREFALIVDVDHGARSSL